MTPGPKNTYARLEAAIAPARDFRDFLGKEPSFRIATSRRFRWFILRTEFLGVRTTPFSRRSRRFSRRSPSLRRGFGSLGRAFLRAFRFMPIRKLMAGASTPRSSGPFSILFWRSRPASPPSQARSGKSKRSSTRWTTESAASRSRQPKLQDRRPP